MKKASAFVHLISRIVVYYKNNFMWVNLDFISSAERAFFRRQSCFASYPHAQVGEIIGFERVKSFKESKALVSLAYDCWKL